MRNFEITHFDFNFEEGVDCQRTKSFRDGDVYNPLVFGSEEDRLDDSERQLRILNHQKRVQAELKARGLLWIVDNNRRKKVKKG